MAESSASQVGVIIGRFQTPELHKAHRALIDEVCARHRKVLVLLGVAPVKLTRRNPLDFLTRRMMLAKAFPDVVTLPVKDRPDDRDWSAGIDEAIATAVGDATVTLYGSRDSFIPHYAGHYPTVELPASLQVSATELRRAASNEVRAERAYRVGVIYAVAQRYPTSYQCVDIVAWRPAAGGAEVLLGRKRDDPAGLWRFPGGFVAPEDRSLEAAALREAREEIGDLALHPPEYAFSARVIDWRYRDESDQILTAVMLCQVMFGKATAGDDLAEVRWVAAGPAVRDTLVTDHRDLWPPALAALEARRTRDAQVAP